MFVFKGTGYRKKNSIEQMSERQFDTREAQRHQLQYERTLEGLKRNYWAVFCVVFFVNITAHNLISAFFFLFGRFSASFVELFFYCFCLRLWTSKHRLPFFFLDSGQVVEIQLLFNWVRSKFVTHLHETNKDLLYPK